MTNPPRRKRFQVHLSTAVVLMFAAGGLIWGNVTPNKLRDFTCGADYGIEYGWPNGAYKELRHVVVTQANNANPFNSCDTLLSERRPEIEWSFAGITIDIAVAIAILFAVWFVCERWIAWRAGRKSAF